MSMFIGWINRADAALLSASSELATLPGSNVQSLHVAKAWHTAAGVKSASLTLDMGEVVQCQLLGLLGTNLTAAATVQVRASDVDPAVTTSLLLDTGALAASAKEGYGQSYHDFAATTARYWRIDIADTAVPDNLQVGRVFLGPCWAPSVGPEFGWSAAPIDPSNVDESYGGQSFADERPKRRVLQFTLNWMDKAEMVGSGFAAVRAAGLTRDVLVVTGVLGSGYTPEESVFGLLQDIQPLVHEKARIFRMRMTVKERL